jgi:hypothetical protein
MAEGFVKIRSFWSPDEANLAKMHLESHGIPVELEGAAMVATAWIDANAVGGVKLLVKQSDAVEALQILDHHSGQNFATESTEEPEIQLEFTAEDEDENEASDGVRSSRGVLGSFRSLKGPFIWAFLIMLLLPLLFTIASLFEAF